MPAYHHRRSIRVPGFDYTNPGLYFITIVTEGRIPHFGEIIDSDMEMNRLGEIVQQEWLRMPNRFPGLRLEEHITMPNHFHALLFLDKKRDLEEGAAKVQPGSLGAMIRAFKSSTTLRYRHLCGDDNRPLWQRSYYEHIVRGARDYDLIRFYILNNPAQWETDKLHV